MKQYFSIAAVIAAACILICSCGRKGDSLEEPIDTNTQTPTGSAAGDAVKKTIDAAGGELASADGRIQVIIPAGALSTAKEISIQPISNQLPDGIGQAYRILPHGDQFSKPVSIVFHYKAEDTLNTLPQFLDVAFQDENGSWQALNNTTVNRTSRALTVTTTHFSDWGYFKSLTLTPAEATVNIEEKVALKVTTRFPYLDPDDQPKGEATTPVYTAPRELRPDEIKGWTYQGEGILVSRGAQAFYTAPSKTPAANPEAIVANIQMHRKGQFMLFSNITVLAEKNVAYLQVDEDYKSPLNEGKCTLYLYGSFGNDPGEGKRTVTINTSSVEIDMWTSQFIKCKIDQTISGNIEITANNKLVAQSTLRKFTGSFIYERFHGGLENSKQSDPLKETTIFDLVYRGFGKPCPASVSFLFPMEGSMCNTSKASATFSGNASITTPTGGCRLTSSVTIPATTSIQNIMPLTGFGLYGFKCYTKEVEGGIELKIFLALNDVVKNVQVKRRDCTGSSVDPARTLDAGLDGFNLTTIPLIFSGTSGLKLKNGLTSGRLVSMILIDAWEQFGDPSHYETDGMVPATFKNYQ